MTAPSVAAGRPATSWQQWLRDRPLIPLLILLVGLVILLFVV